MDKSLRAATVRACYATLCIPISHSMAGVTIGQAKCIAFQAHTVVDRCDSLSLRASEMKHYLLTAIR